MELKPESSKQGQGEGSHLPPFKLSKTKKKEKVIKVLIILWPALANLRSKRLKETAVGCGFLFSR